jgi:CheY-like chemotaxis protein
MMAPTHATILLVEDEAAIRSIMRIFLEDIGCDVIEAQDGREGLERYRALPIDAVISDIHMPEMNGLEMIQAIRQYDPAATMIAMSSDPERLSLAHHAGAQQTLKKPFDLSDLRRVVDWIRVHIGGHKICPSAYSISA